MSNYVKNNLSFSKNGLPIKLGVASTPIHIATASTTDQDEVWLYVNNNRATDETVTIEMDNSTDKITVLATANSGTMLAVPGYVFRNRKLLSASATATELWDAAASVFTSGTYGWVADGGNTIANSSNTLAITYVNSQYGAYEYLRNSKDLSADLIVGKRYRITLDAKYTGGSAGSMLRLYPDAVNGVNFATLTTTLTTYSYDFTCGHATDASLQFYGMGASNVVTVDNLSLIAIDDILVSGYVNSILATSYVRGGARYGYFAGGETGDQVATTDKMTYSTGIASASTISNLSSIRVYSRGISDLVTYGYFVGGRTSSTLLATSDRIVYSTAITSANTISNLSSIRQNVATVNGDSYGYLVGGYTGDNVVTGDRIVFSSGITAANSVSNLSLARRALSGISNGETYGYFSGGYSDAATSITDRIIFSTGVTSAKTSSNLTQAIISESGISDNSLYGYVFAASSEKITFSTEIYSANTVSNPSITRNASAAASDASLYGYVVTGYDDDEIHISSDRIIFSTGITSANTISNLSQARYGLSSLSDFAV